MELATVPPTLFPVRVVVTDDDVFNLIPYALAAPAPPFAEVIPPMLLLFAVHPSRLKLNMPITSAALAELVAYVNESVADWLPMVLLFVIATPLVT